MVSGGGGAYLMSGNSGSATVTVEEAAAAAANMTHATTRVSQATVSHQMDHPPFFRSMFAVYYILYILYY